MFIGPPPCVIANIALPFFFPFLALLFPPDDDDDDEDDEDEDEWSIQSFVSSFLQSVPELLLCGIFIAQKDRTTLFNVCRRLFIFFFQKGSV